MLATFTQLHPPPLYPPLSIPHYQRSEGWFVGRVSLICLTLSFNSLRFMSWPSTGLLCCRPVSVLGKLVHTYWESLALDLVSRSGRGICGN